MSKVNRLRLGSLSRVRVMAIMFGAGCGTAVLLYLAAALHSPVAKDIPPAVARKAILFRLTHFFLPKAFPTGRGALPDRTLEEEYAFWFLQGYRYPRGAWSHPSDDVVRVAAVVAAERYRAEHPNDVDAIMSGYGFRRVNVQGVWSRGVERSEFVPNGQPSGAWWLEGFQEFAPADPPNRRPFSADADVRIVGYLSPEGNYGHLGAWKREVLVESITYSTP